MICPVEEKPQDYLDFLGLFLFEASLAAFASEEGFPDLFLEPLESALRALPFVAGVASSFFSYLLAFLRCTQVRRMLRNTHPVLVFVSRAQASAHLREISDKGM